MVATMGRLDALRRGSWPPEAPWPDREEYFPYGRSSDRVDARNRYRFIGVERDEDTGLCMTGPRTYDPVTGRFLQGDPIVESGWTPIAYGAASQANFAAHGQIGSPAQKSVVTGHGHEVAVHAAMDTDLTLRAMSNTQQHNEAARIKLQENTFAYEERSK